MKKNIKYSQPNNKGNSTILYVILYEENIKR